MTLIHILFYVFASLLLVSAMTVVSARNPVRSVLALILCFVSAAVLWLLLRAEFLGLVLVLVYVGAVMTLFLFVVMMLNIHQSECQTRFVFYLPLVVLGMFGLGFGLSHVLGTSVFRPEDFPLLTAPLTELSNTEQIGAVLYTDYLYPFELAGVILLAAIIAAIGLTLRGSRRGKSERIAEQVRTRKADRLRLVRD